MAKKTVLITGCSDGGMGAALAISFAEAGLYVYATARDVSKMSRLSHTSIEKIALDITSPESIAACVSTVPKLDILVNNAGSSYSMPITDLSIDSAKQLFDVNVWAQLAVTRAFLPLLLHSGGMVVNQTSVVAVAAVPFQSAYNASKAAMSMFSDCLRLELEPFGIKVIDLKTGAVATNLIRNQKTLTSLTLPSDSMYDPARDAVESAMRNDKMAGMGTAADEWAKEVAGDLLKKNPPLVIWRGYNAKIARLGTFFPYGMLDSTIKKMTGLDVVQERLRVT
ncbi:NADPH-dependent 1-acyldihydroxyacetone phosphate [Cyphellophora attinorum]|uniref:NADPH-dependent 1-acyldihydroxyacetone phosphate n=1 Tax=Cyphellophora attinorum TaxID=1664694 RepID=A0A0N1HEP3_9EURO|nr:NADPH-dependent 1-acyldihydroxyacetone phosphate [Phialophora attinorum]KPI43375.1 NADPH-dependent 1-acyldihydroxyacetone phosphate [Phialophora attinorum]